MNKGVIIEIRLVPLQMHFNFYTKCNISTEKQQQKQNGIIHPIEAAEWQKENFNLCPCFFGGSEGSPEI